MVPDRGDDWYRRQSEGSGWNLQSEESMQESDLRELGRMEGLLRSLWNLWTEEDKILKALKSEKLRALVAKGKEDKDLLRKKQAEFVEQMILVNFRGAAKAAASIFQILHSGKSVGLKSIKPRDLRNLTEIGHHLSDILLIQFTSDCFLSFIDRRSLTQARKLDKKAVELGNYSSVLENSLELNILPEATEFLRLWGYTVVTLKPKGYFFVAEVLFSFWLETVKADILFTGPICKLKQVTCQGLLRKAEEKFGSKMNSSEGLLFFRREPDPSGRKLRDANQVLSPNVLLWGGENRNLELVAIEVYNMEIDDFTKVEELWYAEIFFKREIEPYRAGAPSMKDLIKLITEFTEKRLRENKKPLEKDSIRFVLLKNLIAIALGKKAKSSEVQRSHVLSFVFEDLIDAIIASEKLSYSLARIVRLRTDVRVTGKEVSESLLRPFSEGEKKEDFTDLVFVAEDLTETPDVDATAILKSRQTTLMLTDFAKPGVVKYVRSEDVLQYESCYGKFKIVKFRKIKG